MNTTKRYFSASLITILSSFVPFTVPAQNSPGKPGKVSHAEPLYADLVRDLGARKGEKEFNIGSDFSAATHYNKSTFLAEYEFAPVDRLGLEAEADFSLFHRISPDEHIPANKLECVRLSAQYSFLVAEKRHTTLAVGYTQIFRFASFTNNEKNSVVTGTAYAPFFIAAKRWGGNFHTLIYVCTLIEHEFAARSALPNWQLNTSLHYMIPKTKNFIGVELNAENRQGKPELTIRPQVKIQLSKNLATGLVCGFPVAQKEAHTSSFIRMIYEL
jgi:hypothetical protein